jgi:hypothetical protein
MGNISLVTEGSPMTKLEGRIIKLESMRKHRDEIIVI